MPTPAAFAIMPSATLVSRLLAAIDRSLLMYAEIAIQNGDVVRCDV